MRRLELSMIGVFATLVACAPLETYYKPGASVSILNRDTTACEVKALRDVPSSTLTRRKPPIFIPGNRVCNAAGHCTGTRGHYVPGGFETYDPNDGLRLRVERQCMADKGYAPVSIPACPDHIAKAAPAGKTTRLPPLNDQSCVIRNKNGSFQIVTRSG
ncbi:MAG: hypothetical protein ABJL67_21050 [Sulfitobacter sp.]